MRSNTNVHRAQSAEEAEPLRDAAAGIVVETTAEQGASGGNEFAIIVPEGFRIDDAGKASWAVRKIVEARAYAARVQEWADRELHRSEQEESWLLRRFGSELEGWLRSELAQQGGHRRSIALPAGTIGLRQQAAKLEILNEDQVVAWCEQHFPEALRCIVEAEGTAGCELSRWFARQRDKARQRRQIMREPLNKHFAESGEVPDGMSLRPVMDQFYVK